MITCTKILRVEAGHRLLKHESQCKNIHGHSYVFEITVCAGQLDEVGRVIDFGMIKDIVGHWLDTNWDHAFIYEQEDPLEEFLQAHNMKRFRMDRPPTAENLAQYLLEVCTLQLPSTITTLSVVCRETASCFATAMVDDRKQR